MFLGCSYNLEFEVKKGVFISEIWLLNIVKVLLPGIGQ